MSYAYTPGLKVKEFYTVRKERKLPIPGEVLVKVGDVVTPSTIVATTKLPGESHVVAVAEAIGVDPEAMEDINDFMTKKIGDQVKEGEIIAQYSSFFGLSKKICKSPVTGVLDTISKLSGQAFVREADSLVELRAYIPGVVTSIVPKEAVVIETTATYIQGIFGIGGETQGEIMVSGSQSGDITADQITPNCAGKILVASSSVTLDTLKKGS